MPVYRFFRVLLLVQIDLETKIWCAWRYPWVENTRMMLNEYCLFVMWIQKLVLSLLFCWLNKDKMAYILGKRKNRNFDLQNSKSIIFLILQATHHLYFFDVHDSPLSRLTSTDSWYKWTLRASLGRTVLPQFSNNLWFLAKDENTLIPN